MNDAMVLGPRTAPTAPSGGGDGSRDFKTIPAGRVVPIEVVDVVERARPAQWLKEGDPPTQIEFHFKVSEGEFKGTHIWGNAHPYFTWDEKCRFRLWTQALLGVSSLPEGFRLERRAGQNNRGEEVKFFDAFKGLRGRVLIRNYTTRDGQVKHAVENVFPLNDLEDPFSAVASGTQAYDEAPF